MRDIRELAPKPSDAIKAMLAGLRALPSEKFVIDMDTFGTIRGGTCFGCAATCAVFHLAGYKPEEINAGNSNMTLALGIPGQARCLGFDYETLCAFEDALDLFRCGRPAELFDIYAIPLAQVPDSLWTPQLWSLDTDNWEQQLPMIEEYVEKLVAAGF